MEEAEKRLPGQSYRGFAEKVALVTDVASATGRAVALQLALEGAYVIVGYGGEAEGAQEGERVAQELRELGTLAHAVRANVWQPEDVRRLFALVGETFGRLDMLVNSAHASDHSAVDELTVDSWNQIFDVNLKSAFLSSQAAVRLMRGRPKAAICNIASEAGLGARSSEAAHYVAAQAGLIGLTRALAQALAPRIRVNAVAVAGRLSGEPSLFEPGQARVGSFTQATPPDEVARACIYLLSSEAATVTGQTLVVGSL